MSANSPTPPLSNKERVKIPRQHMPEQDADRRRRNFEEVNQGLTVLGATTEALRCLQCTTPKCIAGCPVGVKVKDFVALIVAGDYLKAAAKIREDNILPAITGRVCPQETQCEGCCILGNKFEPVGIGYLERFVADYERESGQIGLPENAPSTGKKVAIVGSGPAGLSAAGDLIQQGHQVTVFEALHEIGGVLVYGIPEFRLPKEIVRREVDVMRAMGVDFQTNVVIGKTVTIDELMNEEGYDAVFVATGAGLPKFLGVPGENLNGVYSANEFLTRVNLMRANDFPEYDEPVYDCRGKDVAVVGGGNTAMDAVRTASPVGREDQLPDLPPLRGRDARAGRGGQARQGRRNHIPVPDQPGGFPWQQGEFPRIRPLHQDGAGRARRLGQALSQAGAGLRVRAADPGGHHRPGDRGQPPGAVHDPRPQDDPQGLHRRRPGDAADVKARRLRRRRHRHRRRHRDPRHGCRPQGRRFDRPVPAIRRVGRSTKLKWLMSGTWWWASEPRLSCLENGSLDGISLPLTSNCPT